MNAGCELAGASPGETDIGCVPSEINSGCWVKAFGEPCKGVVISSGCGLIYSHIARLGGVINKRQAVWSAHTIKSLLVRADCSRERNSEYSARFYERVGM